MSRETTSLLAMNRGLMSRYGVGRVDLKRTGLAASKMTNWVPRVLGSMSMRPGLGYVGTTYDNSKARLLPFVASTDDTALIELTDSLMRVWVANDHIYRSSVSTAVTNGGFDSNVTGWTDSDESGATSQWATGGYLSLAGNGTNYAIRDQQVTVAAGDQNVTHGIRIVVERGPVLLRIGSTSGGDEYIAERTLRTGTHSIAFTPSGNFHIRLSNNRQCASLVDSVAIEASGILSLPAPWAEADLAKVRFAQSADVIFLACEGYEQMRIERWGTTSWSIVKYQPEDGPFRLLNQTSTTLTPSAISGDITLTASKPLFRSDHVGALFKMESTGQLAEVAASGADQWSDEILVTGIGGERRIAVIITGTWSGTVTLQYSVAEPGAWIDAQDWTANQNRTYNDDLDGQIIYYRIGIKSGDYTSGTANCSISIASGSLDGVVRITAVASSTSASAAVLDSLGQTTATVDWWEGAWSERRGWPSAVGLYEGRLWWFGKSNVWASVSDAYESFDDSTEGDSGPISRSIGEGPVDVVNWALPMQQMAIGTTGAELVLRSSSFDEPITPTNFSIKPASTQGSSQIQAQRVDSLGFFVQRSGQRLYMLGYSADQADYNNEDATALVPDLCESGITHIAVQRQPDTRVHCVRTDGTVAMLVFERTENVLAWCEIETDGIIEDVAVLPDEGEDAVYYIVNRVIDGNEVRYIEQWAMESECRGGTLNKQADSFLVYNGAQTSILSNLSHLEGETVVVWGNGRYNGEYVVSSGQISLSAAVTSAIVGLPYTADYESMKGGLAENLPVPMNQRKRISQLGLLLADTHYQGLEFGPDFDHLDPLPLKEFETATPVDTVWEAFDRDFVDFPGEWTTDARICLRATAPKPATVLAVQTIVESNER